MPSHHSSTRTTSSRRRVRFGAVTVVDCSSCCSCDTNTLWFNGAKMQQRFSIDLEKAEREYSLSGGQMPLTTTNSRGLEYHMTVNAKRPKFAALYVQAVVQKSLALRSAAYMGKRVHVESSLKKFASQHAHANRVLAQDMGEKDQQEAMRVYGVAELALDKLKLQSQQQQQERPKKSQKTTPSSTTAAAETNSPTHVRSKRSRPIINRTVSREGNRFMVCPV